MVLGTSHGEKGEKAIMKTFSIGARNERMIEAVCNVCGSDDREIFLPCEGYAFHRCRNCGLVYQYPQPVFDDLRHRYGEAYFDYELTNDTNFFNLMRLGLEDVGFFDIPLSRFVRPTFLDVGCATGMLVRHMRDLGWDARGVEICEESARYGIEKRGVPIDIGTLEEAAYPDGAFSVVHFSHVIEHVPDPRAMLREVRRILAADGLALITTPNVNGFQARLLRDRWRSAIADHLTLFSKRTLCRLFSETGFAIKNLVTWGGIAVGTVPGLIKRPVDTLAKRFGFGDVMLFHVIPQ
jgi:2-polyprenyl-3-methyl-5-hydroxy-6-metoxy-1,4-benzoquinol methylase